jgi:hypothetical protein
VNPEHLEPVTPFENRRRSSNVFVSRVRSEDRTTCNRGHVLDRMVYECGRQMRRCWPCKDSKGQRYLRRLLEDRLLKRSVVFAAWLNDWVLNGEKCQKVSWQDAQRADRYARETAKVAS